jgi:glycerol uptake facilitator-like aquaporin
LFSNNQVVKSDVMPYVLAQVVGGIAALQLHKAVLN